MALDSNDRPETSSIHRLLSYPSSLLDICAHARWQLTRARFSAPVSQSSALRGQETATKHNKTNYMYLHILCFLVFVLISLYIKLVTVSARGATFTPDGRIVSHRFSWMTFGTSDSQGFAGSIPVCLAVPH